METVFSLPNIQKEWARLTSVAVKSVSYPVPSCSRKSRKMAVKLRCSSGNCNLWSVITQIVKFMWSTWGPPGSSLWPHESCYQGRLTYWCSYITVISHHTITVIRHGRNSTVVCINKRVIQTNQCFLVEYSCAFVFMLIPFQIFREMYMIICFQILFLSMITPMNFVWYISSIVWPSIRTYKFGQLKFSCIYDIINLFLTLRDILFLSIQIYTLVLH